MPWISRKARLTRTGELRPAFVLARAGHICLSAGRLSSLQADYAKRDWFKQAGPEDSSPKTKLSWESLSEEVSGGFSWAWLRDQPFFRTSALLFAAGNPVFTGLYLLAILLAYASMRRRSSSPVARPAP